MTKKTRRKLPRGQRTQHGAAMGFEEHGPGCRCRRCRLVDGQGRSLNPELAVHKMGIVHATPGTGPDPAPDIELANAAREVRLAMGDLNTAINWAALAGGKLLAVIDNRAGTETLSSIQADQGYQLMKGLNDAHIALIDFWLEVGKGLS